jgi:hypothetical protein
MADLGDDLLKDLDDLSSSSEKEELKEPFGDEDYFDADEPEQPS